MNDNKNYLSLGNIFNLIKDIASSKSSAMQLELFASIFNVNDLNKTTVNNYCTGYRPIGIIYKQIFIKLINEMKNNYLVFINHILSVLRILDDKIYTYEDQSLDLINNNLKLKELCKLLYDLALSDENISHSYLNEIKYLFDNSNLYECFIKFISYAILDNIQPKYIQEIKVNVNKKEMNDYLKIKLYEGVSYISSLKELANKGNMYALADLGSLEFSGLVSGIINYDASFNYYYESALKGHPKGCWMVSYLILTNKVKGEFNLAWEYLNKSIDLGSIAGLNTIANCYMKGFTPDHKEDADKAIKYYMEASEKGYVYAINNLGKYYEDKDYEKSLNYYKLSADLKESWALNKVGEYFRKNNDLETAFIYYNEAISCPLNEKNYYAYYNLAKYYYLDKEIDKAKEYLLIAKDHGVKEANFLLNKLP